MPDGILIIDDDAAVTRTAAAALTRKGYEVRVAPNGAEGLALVDAFRPDVVVLESRLQDRPVPALVAELRRRDAHLPILLLTGPAALDLAIEAVDRGAQAFLTKPVPDAELVHAVARMLDDSRRAQALAHLQSGGADPGGQIAGMVGESLTFAHLRLQVAGRVELERRTPTQAMAPALLVGEPGTGRALLARALHFDGPRAHGPFVEIRCTGANPHQLDASLFGYERGAVAGAWNRRLGLVEAAAGGTLLLRDIDALPPELQSKLLRLLEDGRVRRLGGVRDHVVEVRVMATAGPGLTDIVQAGGFRPELHARLRTIELHAPPLRARGADILALARWFLAMHGARYGKPGLVLEPEAEVALDRHAWPGNVRELRNAIEQAVLNAGEHLVRVRDLGPCTMETLHPNGSEAAVAEELNLARRERELLVRALAETRWNVSRAARLLGVTRDTLRYRIDKYALTRPTG
jgi:DNA-binding NtrC family response regulator